MQLLAVHRSSSVLFPFVIAACAAHTEPPTAGDPTTTPTGPADGLGGGPGGSGADGGSGFGTGSGPGPGPGGGPRDPRAEYCAGQGPPVQIRDLGTLTTRETCTGAIASQVFAHAICSCRDTNIAGFLTTRSFDSRGDRTLVESGGPVGINGTYATAGFADIGGTFAIAGPQSLTFAGFLRAAGDLRMAGNVTAAGYVDVSRDAFLGGDITVPGYMVVGRDLVQPTGRAQLAIIDVRGQRRAEPVQVGPPCPCGDNQILDIAALIADARTNNDNAVAGLTPNALSAEVGRIDINLPCGRFYVDRIGGIGAIHVRVEGRTALFVGGDVNSIGALQVELGEYGELDLFIGGNLVNIGAGAFGDAERPSSSRIYVAGAGDVSLVGASAFVGNVYAPRSRIAAPGATWVFGSLFGERIDIPGTLSVNYDRDILDAGEDCAVDPPPQGTCDRCSGTCAAHQACVGGTCGACRSDGDCCEPLVCTDGVCGSLLI